MYFFIPRYVSQYIHTISYYVQRRIQVFPLVGVGGHRPLTWVLFGGNMCKNERIEFHMGGGYMPAAPPRCATNVFSISKFSGCTNFLAFCSLEHFQIAPLYIGCQMSQGRGSFISNIRTRTARCSN